MKSKILKFIKPFVAVALGFAFIFSLSACTNKNGGTSGNNGSGTSGNNSPNPSKQTEITITAGDKNCNNSFLLLLVLIFGIKKPPKPLRFNDFNRI